MQQTLEIPGTELQLSRIGLGTTAAGIAWDGLLADEMFDAYLAHGGNVIDTARVYGDWEEGEIGRSERVIGDWLQRSGKRDQIVLMTKGGHPRLLKHGNGAPRMSPMDMREDLELSLRALHTDVIDIYYYHRDDPTQSVAEELEVMETFRREGKIRYYACSNWQPQRIVQADQYCKQHNYRGFVADQALLNWGSASMKPLADKTLVKLEGDLLEYHFQRPQNLAVAYMSVASGFFHQYLGNNPISSGAAVYNTAQNIRLADRCRLLMKKYDASVSQVIIAYLLMQPFQCLPLYGPKTVTQLIDAMDTVNIDFSSDDFQV